MSHFQATKVSPKGCDPLASVSTPTVKRLVEAAESPGTGGLMYGYADIVCIYICGIDMLCSRLGQVLGLLIVIMYVLKNTCNICKIEREILENITIQITVAFACQKLHPDIPTHFHQV